MAEWSSWPAIPAMTNTSMPNYTKEEAVYEWFAENTSLDGIIFKKDFVNDWNSTMSGTYDILDQLPRGMEPVYVDVNNFGLAIKRNPDLHPKTTNIPELDSSPAWTEMVQTGKDDIDNTVYTAIVSVTNDGKGHLQAAAAYSPSSDEAGGIPVFINRVVSSGTQTPTQTPASGTPRTGDETHRLLWLTMLTASMVGLGCVSGLIARRKKAVKN